MGTASEREESGMEGKGFTGSVSCYLGIRGFFVGMLVIFNNKADNMILLGNANSIPFRTRGWDGEGQWATNIVDSGNCFFFCEELEKLD